MSADLEVIARICVDCGFQIHKEIGPGLLESAYELLLAESLRARNLSMQTQIPISIKANGIVIDNAFRADMLINDALLIEIKSTEVHAPIHAKQVITYLRLMQLSLGLLMNFGAPTFKEGIRRIVNNHAENK